MRTLLALLLTAAVLPAQAQTLDICDRTPQVRDAILEALEANDCAAVDSQALAGVDSLDLGGWKPKWWPFKWNQLTALRGRDFADLTGLQTLYLHNNQLTALPDGVFADLASLQRLELPHNQLTALPEGVFDSLTSLQSLWLNNNQLTALPAGVFDDLTSLQRLRLNNNRLTTLPAGVFDGLTGLQALSLNDNRLAGLTRNAPLFQGFSSEVAIRLDAPNDD